MLDRLFLGLVLVAAVGCGVIGGVLFAFSSFVMAGLARIAPAQGAGAMQSINVTAVTPLFMGALFGTALVCLVLAGLCAVRPDKRAIEFVLAGALLYLGGPILVTMAVNVPLNNALAASHPASAEGARLWASYLTRWTAWNHLRALAAIAASACMAVALFKLGAIRRG